MTISFCFNPAKALNLLIFLLKDKNKSQAELVSVINQANISSLRVANRPVIGGKLSDLFAIINSSGFFKTDGQLIELIAGECNLDHFSNSDIDSLKEAEANPKIVPSIDLVYEDYVINKEQLDYLQAWSNFIIV